MQSGCLSTAITRNWSTAPDRFVSPGMRTGNRHRNSVRVVERRTDRKRAGGRGQLHRRVLRGCSYHNQVLAVVNGNTLLVSHRTRKTRRGATLPSLSDFALSLVEDHTVCSVFGVVSPPIHVRQATNPLEVAPGRPSLRGTVVYRFSHAFFRQTLYEEPPVVEHTCCPPRLPSGSEQRRRLPAFGRPHQRPPLRRANTINLT